MEEVKVLKKRLLYQSQHRGMREMDLLLGRFAKRHISSMSQEELKQFEALLALPDQTLSGWFFGKECVPDDFPYSLILKIRRLN